MELEEAKKLVEQEKQDRAKLCSEELKVLLDKHNCIITSIGKFEGSSLQTQIVIKSK